MCSPTSARGRGLASFPSHSFRSLGQSAGLRRVVLQLLGARRSTLLRAVRGSCWRCGEPFVIGSRMTGATDRTLESFRDSATFFSSCRFVPLRFLHWTLSPLWLSGAKPSIGMSLAIPRCGIQTRRRNQARRLARFPCNGSPATTWRALRRPPRARPLPRLGSSRPCCRAQSPPRCGAE